jgi:NADPH:quinone reductase-like Zn-dependent oxidoreductase
MRLLPRKRWTRILLIVLVGLFAYASYSLLRSQPPQLIGSGEPMQAVVHHEYGPPDVLRFEQREKPLPKDTQVLVKVRAAAANPLDWHTIRGTPYVMRIGGGGVGKPSDPRVGVDFAGEVVMVGKSVTEFKPGDEVFGVAAGAFAEYALAIPKRIALKPPGMSFEHAASVGVAAITALQGLRDSGQLKPGQKVLINGASGGVGTFAVQIAKSLGAEVTGVCSGRNVELVRSLGADHVFDYTKEDFTESGQKYDVVLDNVGNRKLRDVRRVMTENGIYVLIGGGGPDAGNWVGPFKGPIKAAIYAPFVSQDFGMMLATVTTADLNFVSELMESGKVKAVVDKTYPLRETAEAIRYLETGRARGKVVIIVDDEGTRPDRTSHSATTRFGTQHSQAIAG